MSSRRAKVRMHRIRNTNAEPLDVRGERVLVNGPQLRVIDVSDTPFIIDPGERLYRNVPEPVLSVLRAKHADSVTVTAL